MVGMITKTAGIPIVAVPSDKAEFRIHMGPSSDFVMKNFKDDLKELSGCDGYALRRKGIDVACFGATSRGTIHAMARLLEKNSDFIWFRPDTRYGFSYTPVKVLDFKNADEISKPAFPLRTWGGPGNNDFGNCHRWYTFNFTNLGYNVRDGIFNAHSYRCKELGQFCTIGKNFMTLPFMIDEKPEHYPMVNGVRRYKNRVGQPCYTNPEVVSNSIKALSILLKEIPEELDFFSYDYSDSWICCECDECMKPIELPDGTTLAPKSAGAQADPWFRSTRTFMIGNLIAKEVNRLHPGLPTQMLAYIYTSANPAVKLDPNLKVLFASYDTGNMRFPLHDQMTADWYNYAPESWGLRFKKWIEENPASAGIYEYFFTSIPAMFADAFAENLRDMVRAGAGWRIYSQSQGDDDAGSIESFGKNATMWDMNAMDQWIISRLMWDPNQDVKELRAEFISRVYQNAKDEMTEFYRIFGEVWLNPENKSFINCHTWAPNVYYDYIQKPKLEKSLFDLIDKAKKKTKSEAAKTHLERKLAAYKSMKEASGRVEIPVVEELATEWSDFSSPHWNRTVQNSNFRVPLNKDWNTNLATNKTTILTACDNTYLYLRIQAFSDGKYAMTFSGGERPSTLGDTVEMRFKYGNKTRTFVVGNSGAYADYENWNYTWNSKWDVRLCTMTNGWTATCRIPMQAIREKPSSEVKYLYMRTARNGEISFSRSDKNRTMTYPCDHGNVFSTFIFPDDSLFKDELTPEAALQSGEIKNDREFAKIDVAGAQPYSVRFKARNHKLYVPEHEHLHQEASRRNGKFIPQWEFVFELEDGTEKVVSGRYKNITGRDDREYADQFIAPEGAKTVRLRIKEQGGKFESNAVIDENTLKIEPLDMQGNLNLNWDFSCGNTFTAWEYDIDGVAMRVVDGKTVMDSGYGVCSAPFPLKEGKSYVITGKHKIYAGYNPIEICYMDKDGKHLRWGSFSSGKEEFEFRFSPPKGTAKGFLRIYSQFLESCSVREK